MKIATRICLLLIGVSIGSTVLAADDPLLKAIGARKSEMKLRAFNVEPLFAMAKGKMEYDAKLATKLAKNLKVLTRVDNGRAWAQGSDNEAYPGKTKALPKIWTTYPEIAEYGKRFVTAVDKVAGVAGNGLDALRAELGDLGKSCKGCHDEFREKE